MKRKIYINSFGFPINCLTEEIIEGEYSESEIVSSSTELPSPIQTQTQTQIQSGQVKPKLLFRTERVEEVNNEAKCLVKKGDNSLKEEGEISDIEKEIASSIKQKSKDFDKEVKLIEKNKQKKKSIEQNNINIIKPKDEGDQGHIHLLSDNTIRKEEKEPMIRKEHPKHKTKHNKQMSIKDTDLNQSSNNSNNINSKLININEIKQQLSFALISSNPNNKHYLNSIYNKTNQIINDSNKYTNLSLITQSLNQSSSKEEQLTGLYLFLYLNKYILSASQQSNSRIQITNDSWFTSTSVTPSMAPSLIKQLTKSEIDQILKQNKVYSNFLFILNKYKETGNDMLLKVVLQKEGIMLESNQDNIAKVLYKTDYFNIVILYSKDTGYSHRVDFLNMSQ